MNLRLFKSCFFRLTLFALLFLETGCSVLAVADAAVSAGATVVKAGASAAGTVVDAVLPSKDKK